MSQDGGAVSGPIDQMVLIRVFEERIGGLFREGRVPGDVHLSVGQEAVSVGVCAQLRNSDYAAGSHRSHGLALAKGVPLVPLIAELMGRSGGLCLGRGGSMHIACKDVGFLGAFPVVGAAVPIATGAALTAKHHGTDDVAVAFFGDGALNQGATMEALNLAAVFGLPTLFVLENNQWAEQTHVSKAFRIDHLVARASAFGIPAQTVDGQDVGAVSIATEDALSYVRGGKGPRFIECLTDRFRGHYEGDPGGYRSPAEEETARSRDPINIAADQYGLTETEIADIYERARTVVESAITTVEAQPEPGAEDFFGGEWADEK